MDAIILAGGRGERLRPLTDTTPKPLLPIQGMPIMEHAIRNCVRYGVKRIILSIGYRAELIKEYFGDGARFGVAIEYCIEESPMGTGGAVKIAGVGVTEPFVLLWGDNVSDVNIDAMKRLHTSSHGLLTMALTHREDVEHFGVASLEGSKITGFVEKPNRENAPSTLINAGVFIVDPTLLPRIPEGVSNIERDVFEKVVTEGRVYGFVHEGRWYPTDTLEKYDIAKEKFRSVDKN